MNKYLLLLFLLACTSKLSAESYSDLGMDSALFVDGSVNEKSIQDNRPFDRSEQTKSNNHILALSQHCKRAFQENKRLTAALLTFSLGMLGIHRLYLGTKPWIPAAYLFTFGGGFFILPLIDCIAILSSKDLTRFLNNDHFIMWINPEK
jgi:TM2 domain-containing membrane protein YozV